MVKQTSEVERRGERRRFSSRYVVPHPVYAWFLKALGLGSLSVALVLTGALWWQHREVLDTLETTGLMDPNLGPVIAAHSARWLQRSSVALTLFSVWMILLASYLFHRVAGPMYRLSDHLERCLSGSDVPQRLRFRKSDQFQQVAEMVNQVLAERLAERGLPELQDAPKKDVAVP